MAWRRLDDVPASPRPWLIGIARNVRLNLRRSARRHRAVIERLTETIPGPGVLEPSRDEELVHAALVALPEHDREVLMLAIWDDLDRSAIAEVMGCSKANASLRLHRARRRFAASLDQLRTAQNPLVSSSLISGGADVQF